MKIEITGKSLSKKGTVWLQAKLIKPEGQDVYHVPAEGEVYECVQVSK